MKGGTGTPSKVSSWAVLKRCLIIFLPLAALLLGILTPLYYTQVKTDRLLMETRGVHKVDYLMEITVRRLKSIVSDLMFLSEQNELHEMFESGEARRRKAVSEEYHSFIAKKKIYDQIRFLDEKGVEVVRVNFRDGKTYTAPDEELQLKASRYYFNETLLLERGEVFVSPFDLNVEDEEIEQPLKPTIRLATPVFDSQDRKRGILVLNYLGAELIHDLERASLNASGQVMFLNSDGFWLKGRRPEDEWGFMYAHGNDRRFGNAFLEAWERISEAESGHFYDADGLFTFATVYPVLEAQKSSNGSGKAFDSTAERLDAKEYYWKIVSHVSPDVLNAESRKLLSGFLWLYVVLLVPLAPASWFLTQASVRRKQAEVTLQRAHDELERQVERHTVELSKANEDLQQEITERKRVGDALEKAHEWRKLLSHMRDFLQSSFGTEEAYTTVSQFAQKLLPGSSGALYLVSASRSVVEDVIHWGESLSTEPVFGPDECWALRRGTSHLVEDSSQIPVCQHMRGTPPDGCFLCVPMIAHGEALGVLYLEGLNKVQRLKKIWRCRERSWPSLWPELSPQQLQT